MASLRTSRTRAAEQPTARSRQPRCCSTKPERSGHRKTVDEWYYDEDVLVDHGHGGPYSAFIVCIDRYPLKIGRTQYVRS
jgi:hypothetical protein